ncbi:unnamed protein product [Prorocentrum cordatum]|uniref:STI1 domain-containing protein n=1 Tax=Prorocentrum cordatum TaxID=2364126 RepID=A0ABN9SXB5_9DINO|nr:unnamed protein product [Polarella glacialis]
MLRPRRPKQRGTTPRWSKNPIAGRSGASAPSGIGRAWAMPRGQLAFLCPDTHAIPHAGASAFVADGPTALPGAAPLAAGPAAGAKINSEELVRDIMQKLDPQLRSIVQAHPELTPKLRGAIDEELSTRGPTMTPQAAQEFKAGLMGELEEMNQSVKNNPALLAMITRRLDQGGRAVAAAAAPPVPALAVALLQRRGRPGARAGRAARRCSGGSLAAFL